MRNGSVPHALALALEIRGIPETLRPKALELLCEYLDERNPTEGYGGFLRVVVAYAVLKSFHRLIGASGTATDGYSNLTDVVTSNWCRIFHWSQQIIAESISEDVPLHPALIAMRSEAVDVLSKSFYIFSITPHIPERLFTKPEVMKLIAKLYFAYEPTPKTTGLREEFPACLLISCFNALSFPNEAPLLDAVVEAAGGSGNAAARLVVRRLHWCTLQRNVEGQEKVSTTFMLMNLFMSSKDHILRRHLLQNHSIAVMTRAAIVAASGQIRGKLGDTLMTQYLSVYRTATRSDDVSCWIKEGARNGLLRIFTIGVATSSFRDSRNLRLGKELLELLTIQLMRYNLLATFKDAMKGISPAEVDEIYRSELGVLWRAFFASFWNAS